MEAFRWAGEHGLVADGVVEPPPNGAPFKPNVQQRRYQEQRGGAGAGRRGQGTRLVSLRFQIFFFINGIEVS